MTIDTDRRSTSGGPGGANNFVMSAGPNDSVNLSAAEYGSYGSGDNLSGTEANHDAPFPFAGSYTYLGINVSTNGLNGDQTFATRVNGVSGVTVTIGAGLFGKFSNTGTQAVAVDDNVNYMRDASAASSGTSQFRALNAGGTIS